MDRQRKTVIGCALVAGAGVGLLSGVGGVFTRAVCASLGIARGGWSLVPAIAVLLSAALAPHTARLFQRKSPRRAALAGAAVCGCVPFLYAGSGRLWHLCAAAALNGLFLGRITMLGVGSVLAPLIAAAATLLTIPMRLLIPRACPRLGAGRTLLLLCAGAALAAGNALFWPRAWSVALHPPLLALCAAANALPCAILARDGAGRQDSRAYARLTAAASIGGACGTPLAGFVFDAAGIYRPMWLFCIALSAGAAAALRFLPQKQEGKTVDFGQKPQNSHYFGMNFAKKEPK